MCSLERRGRLFILTLTGPTEHRLGPTLIADLRAALAQVRAAAQTEPRSGLALITTAHGKFFSNGFDLAWTLTADSHAQSQQRLNDLVNDLRHVIADLISLPVPTIAAVTGHAAAAGLILALAHDYVVMRKDRGVLYLSELDLGIPIPDYFLALINSKIGDVAARRDLALAAKKIGAAEAAERGIVDVAADGAEETVVEAVGIGERLGKRKWDGRVYASIRMGLFDGLSRVLGLEIEPVLQFMQRISSKI